MNRVKGQSQPTEQSSNKLIFKNTIFLFIRMIVSMAVSLYTSRLIIDILGISDYGIYNVVSGIIVLIAIINSSMTSATQRFITFEIGKNDTYRVLQTFSMSMTVHIIICAFVIFIAETIGLYYIETYINAPADRSNAVFWLYQIAIATVVLNILRVPYNASIIAYEKMDFFAYISILEVAMQLICVYCLTIINSDKLIAYGILIFITTGICTTFYYCYCRFKLRTCIYIKYFNKEHFLELFSFFGWNLFGNIAVTGSNQIGNMLLNYYCGPGVNAAFGVANRVNTAIAGLSNNFQVAYTPQITKLYSQNRKSELFILLNRSSAISYYLLFCISMPIYLNCDYILNLWLVDVPVYTSAFCQLLIIYSLIDSIQAPFFKVINATGNIKVYEIWLNILLFFNIPVSFLLLRNGFEPYYVTITSVFLNLISAIIRTVHVKIQVGVPVKGYLYNVLFRAAAVSLLYILFARAVMIFCNIESFWIFCIFYICSIGYILTMSLVLGITKNDRTIIINVIKKKLWK